MKAMGKKFKGKIAADVRNSVPDWDPYKQPEAKKGAPNVLLITWDDVGFAAFESFGGMIKTPTMDRIAERGLRYTQFHTTALCSPTRASLLTGRNHTTVGMACIGEATTGFPGSNGHIPFETATLPEVLSEQGYNTYMLGKWHLCPEDEMNIASSKRNWPTGRGFERFYGFLGGETNQWYPDLVQDQQFVDQPYTPEEGYHLSKDLADKAISMIADAKQIAPEKPFFMYYAPGTGHAPHHVPKEWADKYKGKFDMGYEKYREITLEKQKKLGIMPENTALSPINSMINEKSPEGLEWPEVDVIRPWESLGDDEKRLFSRMAEVYAGFVEHADHHIGRILDHLEKMEELDNTLIVVISDNGASGEGGPNGSVNENLFFNNVPDDIEKNLEMIDDLGTEKTYNHYPNGWAQAFCTPFKMYKRYAWNGGISDPMLISWPEKISQKGEMRSQYHHVSDIAPTIYELLDIDLPEVVKGYTQWPLEGTSMAYSLENADIETEKETQYYTMLGSRGIWHKGWKANTVHPTVSGWSHFSEDRWALYNVDEDRSETHDLAEKYPEKIDQLKMLWAHEAGKYFGLPIEDRTAREVLGEDRPKMTKDTDHYVYYPHTGEVPESVAVNVRGRSFKILADVEITENSEGVLFSHGSYFGGHALYVKDQKLCYSYNYLGMEDQIIVSDKKIKNGECILGMEFIKEDIQNDHAVGAVKLYINDEQVGERFDVKTQLGKFALGGEGLNIGLDRGAPVTVDYAGERPWKFVGGEIKEVTVDVSGEAYIDLEKEVIAMMKRD